MSTISTVLPKILNYQGKELIHKSDRTLVYRGQNVENGQAVVIKLMRDEYPSFNELVQFRNQYTISKNLEVEGIVKPYALERYENGYALIMEDIGGVALAEYKGKNPLMLSHFFNIAIQLAEILHQLHQHQIIHKDIKPANILIQPETQHVKLIDFSISTLLPKETQTVKTPNVLEGTLAYLAPEQTGRMNRGIDYRSDFYALGVTFYELLAGTIPFNSDDPLEVIHAHIAQNPEPICNWISLEGKFCPTTLSNIVLKLMAKNAEDRYQSALGLKYDLEKCQRQYRETGEIGLFELGERDICDRFLIPEKLYGREKEVQALLNAFERVARGNTEIILVAGYSGIGKTAIVNEVHKPIVRQKGYFIKGKFDQFNRNIPFSAFVSAFRDLMGQLLAESNTRLATWKTKILTAVGENGQVLIDVIPELEGIIGKQSPVPELEGNAAQNRFNLLFEKFIAVFTTQEHPLTLFLDDLQWADSASLNLLKVLMAESRRGYLLLLGAYRDNEVFPAHPLMLALAELERQQTTISTITLAPLSVDRINQLVAETLSCSVKRAEPLTYLVYQKTKGNPFFTVQFLKGLQVDGLVVFNPNLGYWECDLVQVRDAALTDDVVEFMVGRLYKLPEATQNALKLAACIGNQFDLETLAIICEIPSEEVAANLWSALAEGLILPQSEAYKFFQGWEQDEEKGEEIAVGYRFLHDRVQQAAYSLIPESQKQKTHYCIGQLLLQQIPPEAREDSVFVLVNQLNYGIALMTQQQERDELAQLNLIACRRARNATAYEAGREYAETGLSLLRKTAWQHQYDLSLAFYDLMAELAFLCGDLESMERFIEEIVTQSRSLLDCVRVYRLKIQASASQHQLIEAIAIALDFLEKLGIAFPESPTEEDVRQGIAEVRQLMGDRDIESLVNLPRMSDARYSAIVQIANGIMPAVFLSCPSLFPLLVCATIQLSLEYGNAPASAYSYSCYGLIACKLLQEVDTGVRFGRLGLQVVSKLKAKAIQPEVASAVGSCILHRKFPMRTMLPVLREGYETALEIGNLEFAGYTAYLFCLVSFWCNQLLSTLRQETSIYGNALIQFNQLTSAYYCQLHRQATLNLLGESEHPTQLSGEAFQETKSLQQMQEAKDLNGLYFFYLLKLMLCYLFGDIESAQNYSTAIKPYFEVGTGSVGEAAFYFYDSLIALASLDSSSEKRAERLEQVEQNQIIMQQHWASHAPMNYQHKVDLIEAEKCRILGEKLEAIECYDRAIAGAKENEYIQEEALANELFAKFYLDWDFGSAQSKGRTKEASLYMQEAYYCYTQWGAKAKTTDLEQRYPELLKPILQRDGWLRDGWLRDRASSSATATISTLTSNSHSQTATMSNLASILDFSSLLKASRTLSGEIELDRLLATLMKIILENAGATKGALLLTNETGLTIEAIAIRTDAKKELQLDLLHQSLPFDDYPDLPAGLINYVRRTTETVLLDAKSARTQFATDNYLLRFSPQSLLCLPLLERGNLIGILYLENRLTADAFTRDRIDLLDALCAQAAISLTNARLYRQARQAFTDLQQAQLQLVQNEKMATLGNLVAGVAHEINNPVGFLVGNITMMQEYLQDLCVIINGYRREYPNPSPELADEIEELELDYLLEDMPKTLTSMQTGIERIRNISTSLRTFSRTDADTKTEFNVHEGLDSTLLILKYRLKANENRPGIEIIKNYEDIPPIQCYPGQMNQVFMNLLANAIDAIDDSNQGKTYTQIETAPNCITISTKFSEAKESVTIAISDNGVGIPEEVRARIFEQGFTTKAVGKGTGLGMAISYQIVTEKHGGAIACYSELDRGTELQIVLPLK
ncbi:MAG: AAA family ATPase [Cyanobacteria bacterium P01_E01_bin.42]